MLPFTSPQRSQPAPRAQCCGTWVSHQSAAQAAEPSWWRWMPASLWPPRGLRRTAAAGGRPRSPDTVWVKAGERWGDKAEQATYSEDAMNCRTSSSSRIELNDTKFSWFSSNAVALGHRLKTVTNHIQLTQPAFVEFALLSCVSQWIWVWEKVRLKYLAMFPLGRITCVRGIFEGPNQLEPVRVRTVAAPVDTGYWKQPARCTCLYQTLVCIYIYILLK